MVRIALVNMYLHSFPDPSIVEYDTLTSEEKWDELYDCVLANPPFMTPKGGIRPHKRFSVQATRSEVLFVDYIMEHLTKDGRAGVIVPEGIIFQSQTAYRELRRKLVEENYLYAVVSLPAGVFNPYSGVKTSILLIDKKIARERDEILFVKVANDGFDLGAQRKEITQNNLPLAEKVLKQLDTTEISHFVSKKVILKTTDVSLTGDRFKKLDRHSSASSFPTIPLGEIIKFSSGKFLPSKNVIQGNYPIYGGNGINGYHNEFFVQNPTLVIGRVGEYCGAVHLTLPNCWVTDNALMVTESYKPFINEYLLYTLRYANLNQYAKKGGQPSISQGTISGIKIPFPPLKIQQQIVAELSQYQKVIDGARIVVENYRPYISRSENWKKEEIGDLFTKVNNLIQPTEHIGQIKYIGLENITQSTNELIGNIDVDISSIKSTKTKFKKGDILYGKLRPNLNKVYFADFDGICSTDIFVLRPTSEKILTQLFTFILSLPEVNAEVLKGIKGAQLPRVNWQYFSKIRLPVPPTNEQKRILATILREKVAVAQNQILIEMMKSRINQKLSEIWGDPS